VAQQTKVIPLVDLVAVAVVTVTASSQVEVAVATTVVDVNNNTPHIMVDKVEDPSITVSTSLEQVVQTIMEMQQQLQIRDTVK
jgi:catabolite regulation protein CreA